MYSYVLVLLLYFIGFSTVLLCFGIIPLGFSIVLLRFGMVFLKLGFVDVYKKRRCSMIANETTLHKRPK